MSEIAMLRQLTQTSSSRNFGGVGLACALLLGPLCRSCSGREPDGPRDQWYRSRRCKTAYTSSSIRTVTIFEGLGEYDAT